MSYNPSQTFSTHLARLKTALKTNVSSTLSEFIEAHTYLRGKPFSFHGHEYQRDILNDTSQNIVIRKSAQIGISEMSSRLAVSRCVQIPGFSTIYTLPSATAAQNFMKTRINPLVDGSPYLKEAVSYDTDNASVKRFGESFLYLRGCQVDRQAISIPADLLVLDEVDNSDLDVMTLYESRIIHSPYKLTVKLSTPTVPNYGISAAFDQSKRKFHFAQCHKCSHWFLPDYTEHVRVPGFTGDILEVRKSDFASSTFRWSESYIECPSCKGKVELAKCKRQWVVENPNDAYFDSGYQVGPFSCPETITPADLVKASVTFERPQDFLNQRLGLAMASSESSLLEEELNSTLISSIGESSSYSIVMGLDMGNTCWAVLAAVFGDGSMIVVKTEGIPAHKVVERTQELVRQYRVRMVVVDRHPLTEAVYQIQTKIRNSFAGIFVNSTSVEMFRVSDKEQDLAKGVQGMRQVNIHKDVMMDILVMMLRSGQIKKVSDDNDRHYIAHLQDNKRIRMFKNNEMTMTWVKTTGEDHLHMALGYALVASRIVGVASGSSVRLPMMSTFKVRERA